MAVHKLSDVTAVSAGGYFNLALLHDGRVMAWGNNTFDELGDGTTVSRELPVMVRSRHGVTAVSAGGYHSLAIAPYERASVGGAR